VVGHLADRDLALHLLARTRGFGCQLVTRGIYSVIRHPMYASQWIFSLAAPLLLQNWIAGFLNLPIFIPFYLLRVKAEEQMMLERFGDQYRSYMQKVGAVFPKF